MEYSKENFAFRNINELKPTLCASCKADGYAIYGTCEKCLRNQAWNKEYVETHLFVVDDMLEGYHCTGNGHDTFKRTFYRKENEHPYLYYGIELEIGFDEDETKVFEDEDYDDYSETDQIESILQKFSEITEGMFVYEKDGSVTNGVECISRPTSIAQWTDPKTVEKLKNGLEYLKSEGAYVDQPDGNGMHIHISSKFFDYGKMKRENKNEAYKDMDWLFQFFQPEIEKLSGRKYTSYCQSKVENIKRQYGIGQDARYNDLWNIELEMKGKMKKGGNIPMSNHRYALEMSGPTIEARVFKSTIDYKHVLANIEFMRNIAHAVRNESTEGKTFRELLHTKDNLFLDEWVENVRKKCFKNKEKFDLDKVTENEMEIK